jgi:hypothetical protein
MRAIRALFRGWLNHPWRAFWLTVVAFYAGLFSLVLVAPRPAALTVGPVFVIGVVLILLASAGVSGLMATFAPGRGHQRRRADLAPPVGMRGEGAPFDGMTPVSRSRNRSEPVLRRVPRCAARCNVVTLKLLRKWRARPTNPLP